MFGCSLGAICGTLYLIHDAENTPVRAAAFYGAPLTSTFNDEYFQSSGFGLYNYMFGSSWTKKMTPMFEIINNSSSLK